MTVLTRASTLALASLTVAASTATAQQSLTIYQDGRVLVRRTFGVAVPQGESSQRVEVGPINASSLFALDPGVSIVRASFDGAVDEMSVLRRAVGRELKFVTPPSKEGGRADTVTATVIGVDPLRLRLADGSVTFSAPGRALYPADLVVVDPALTLSLVSAQARQQLGLGYFTQGANWQAAYSVVLGKGTARITGNAAIESGQLSAENAEVQLLAGDVGVAEQPPQVMYARAQAMEMRDAVAMKAMGEQSVGEFHLYSLGGTHSLRPGETTLAALFEPASTPFRKEFLVRGDIPYWGFLPQQGDEGEVPVEISYTLERKRDTSFGDAPLPAGTARLYEPDAQARLQLVGEASTDHTPAGEELRLRAGTAFDITARRIQTSYTTSQEPTGKPRRTIAIAEYRVTLNNAKDEAVTVVVEERRAGEWRIEESSVPADKVSSTITRFKVDVPARGDAVLTYRVWARW
jgi:hypothetical protein